MGLLRKSSDLILIIRIKAKESCQYKKMVECRYHRMITLLREVIIIILAGPAVHLTKENASPQDLPQTNQTPPKSVIKKRLDALSTKRMCHVTEVNQI